MTGVHLPDGVKEAGEKAGQLARERTETVIALIVGVAFAILGIAHLVGNDVVTEATLLVLSVLALAVLRDYVSREGVAEAVDRVETSVTDCRREVDALASGEPYHVLRYEALWDIDRADGSMAQASKRKRIRFAQNRVLSLYDFAAPSGTLESYTCSPGQKVDEFDAGGRRYLVISLRRFFDRGEETDFTVNRTLRDTFLGPHESVTVESLDPCNELSMTVIWPQDRPPTAVRVERSTGSRDVEPHELRSVGDRRAYTYTVTDPARPDRLTIEWDW